MSNRSCNSAGQGLHWRFASSYNNMAPPARASSVPKRMASVHGGRGCSPQAAFRKLDKINSREAHLGVWGMQNLPRYAIALLDIVEASVHKKQRARPRGTSQALHALRKG